MPKRKRDLELARLRADIRTGSGSSSDSDCIIVRMPEKQPAFNATNNRVRKRAKIADESPIPEPDLPPGKVFVPRREQIEARQASKQIQRTEREAEQVHQASTKDPTASSALLSFKSGGLREAEVSPSRPASSPLEAFTSGRLRDARSGAERPSASSAVESLSDSPSEASRASSVAVENAPASSRTSAEIIEEEEGDTASANTARRQSRRQVTRISYVMPPLEVEDELASDASEVDEPVTKRVKRRSDDDDVDFEMEDAAEAEEEDEDVSEASDTSSHGAPDDDEIENEPPQRRRASKKPAVVKTAEKGRLSKSVEAVEKGSLSKSSQDMISYCSRRPWYCVEDETFYLESAKDKVESRQAKDKILAQKALKAGDKQTYDECMSLIDSHLHFEARDDCVGLNHGLPPVSEINEMFSDMVDKAEILGLKDALRPLQRPLRVATMCSGTESPLLAIQMIAKALQKKGVELRYEHLFSAEIVPFKQAYIQRNFNPSIIFRDVGELVTAMQSEDPHATTAYNASVPVPGDVDLLIAGTSCKDFSQLNNWQKTLEVGGSGESSKTWFGVLSYVSVVKPKIVILENVRKAPYDRMMQYYRDLGYEVSGVFADTKNFYLPQTRERGYMVAFRKGHGASVEGAAQTWAIMIGKMQRHASSPVTDFMLPADELRSRPHESLEVTEKGKKEVDWAVCQMRHIEARQAENLGSGREITKWHESGTISVPEHASIPYFKTMVNRRRDYLEIGTLRKAPTEDVRFKSRPWNISQNVHMTLDSVPYGVVGCITPTGAVYASDAARALTAEELLKIQGIPLDRVSFTNETQAEMQDLAGNAMSSTVIGAAILCALTLGMPAITSGGSPAKTLSLASEEPEGLYTPTQAQIRTVAVTPAVQAPVTGTSTFDVQTMSALAACSVRRCYCEGPQDLAEAEIQQCADCAHTTCLQCGGNPPHNYVVPESLNSSRSSPLAFEKLARRALPLHLTFDDHRMKGLIAHVETRVQDSDYRRAVSQALQSQFDFTDLLRKKRWIASYSSPCASLQLVLGDQPEWLLYALPKSSLAVNHPLREKLRQPVARCLLTSNSLFDGQWQWRDLPQSSHGLRVEAQGKMIPSWLQKLKLPNYVDSNVPSQLEVRASHDLAAISGLYTALPDCGTAYDSLYVRSEPSSGKPLYLFQDPTRTGDAALDHFVFGYDHERLDYGESRITVAHIESTWKPWTEDAAVFSKPRVFSDGIWRETDLKIVTFDRPARILLPSKQETFELQCQSAELIVSCELPLSVEPTLSSTVVNADPRANNTTLLAAHAWVLELLRRHLPTDVWRQLDEGMDFRCTNCAPERPALRWIHNQKGKLIPSEDMHACAAYERKIKQQRAPLVLAMKVDESTGVKTLSFGIDLAAMAHKAAAALAVPATSLRWRLQSVAELTEFRFRSFNLQATTGDPYAGSIAMLNDDDGTQQDLMRQQKVQLAWLQSQESGQGAAFEMEATQEARSAGWRAEVRATSTVHVRGSICADHPGFGKTLTSLALIHTQLQDGDAHVMQDLEHRQSLSPGAKGLIPTKATLIVTPAVLTGQWVMEAAAKFGYTDDLLYIRTPASLDKLKIDDFKAAKLIVVSRDMFVLDTYSARLADFVAMPGPASKTGRAFSQWHTFASSHVHLHLDALMRGGIAGLQKYNHRIGKERNDAFWESAPWSEKPAKVLKKAPATSKLMAPLFEMFWFNRIIIDEFHDCSPQVQDVLRVIQADKRHLLSGTPKLNDSWELAQTASLLGISLSYGSHNSKAMTRKNMQAVKSQATDMERFEANQQVISDSMHNRIYERAQVFLDTFARQNIMDGVPLPIEEHLVPVTLDHDHMVLYKEVSQRLSSQEMVLRNGKNTRKTGQDKRFTRALYKRTDAEEVLSQRAAMLMRTALPSIDEKRDRTAELPNGLQGLISNCKSEIKAILSALEEACRKAQISRNVALERYEAERLQVGPHGVGDAETINTARALIASTKGKQPRQYWITASKNRVARDSDDEDSDAEPDAEGAPKPKTKKALEAILNGEVSTSAERKTATNVSIIVEELLTAIRAERFANNVSQLVANPSCEAPGCSSQVDKAAVSGLCGHMICESCYDGDDPSAICPVSGCEVAMRDHHLLWQHTLADTKVKTTYGAKIETAVTLLRTIRQAHDKAVLFVQYDSQLEDLDIALKAANIAATVVYKTPQAGELISNFGDSEDTVIVLDASSETAAGSNLQCANHVIFMSPLLCDTQYKYDSTMAQAIGRVKRHGQTKNIHVYRLVALYTIDVDILEAREYRAKTWKKQALTQQGAPAVATPPAKTLQGGGKRPMVNVKTAKLVREANYYSLRPYSWVSGQRGGAGLEKQDFSSQITFSKAFQD